MTDTPVVDQDIRWLRRVIIRSILTQSFVCWAVVAAVVGAALLAGGTSPTQAGVVAVLAGQMIAIGRIALSLTMNPINHEFLADYIERPLRFEARREVGSGDDPHVAAGELKHFQLVRIATMEDASSQTPAVFDLFQSRNSLVTAAVSRESGSTTLLSLMADGRILQTVDMLVPPSKPMIVNTEASGSVGAMIISHRDLMLVQTGRGNPPKPSTAALFAASVTCEQNAFADLGPFLGSFLNLDRSKAVHRIQVRPEPNDLLNRSLGTPQPQQLAVDHRPLAQEQPTQQAPAQPLPQRAAVNAAM